MMSRQGRRAMVGVVATLVVTGICWLLLGGTAGRAAAMFGVMAVLLQLIAGVLEGRGRAGEDRDPMRDHAIGMGLRMVGVPLIAVAVIIDRATFPPEACAAGYLGTVLPLLWLETRLA